MEAANAILIVGGYGQVGRHIAAHLAPLYPGRVRIAGRDFAKAAALAGQLGHEVHPLRLDVGDPRQVEQALDGVRLVINCIDLSEPHLLHAAVNRGHAYLDITAHTAFWQQACALHDEARRTGARVLLGAGLVPGIANVMARAAVDRIGQAEQLNTAVLLSLGDAFGPAALDYMLASASEAFTVTEDGQERSVRNFTDGRQVSFPAPLGLRTVYRFALPEQVFYPRTLGLRSASTRITFDPPWVSGLLALLARVRFPLLLKQTAVRRAAVRLLGWLQTRYQGMDTYALQVEALGGQRAARLGLIGKNESAGTALGAALMACMLYDGDVNQPGVWLPEQITPSRAFFATLAERGLRLQELD